MEGKKLVKHKIYLYINTYFLYEEREYRNLLHVFCSLKLKYNFKLFLDTVNIYIYRYNILTHILIFSQLDLPVLKENVISKITFPTLE